MQRTAALLVLIAAALAGAWLLMRDGGAPDTDLDATGGSGQENADGGPTLTARGAPRPPGADTSETAAEPETPRSEAPPQRAVSVRYRGRVVDAEGRPIDGATVILRDRFADLTTMPPLEVRTGSDGTFEMRMDVDAGRYDLVVLTKDGRLLYDRDALITGAEPVVLAVEEGPALTVILTREGKPVPGVTVSLAPPNTTIDGDTLAESETDSQGSARLGKPPKGRYDLHWYAFDAWGRLAVAHESETPVRVDAGAYVAVKGRVVDGANGRPIPEAELFLRGRRASDGAHFLVTIEASDGSFEMEVPRAGYNDVIVYGEGFGPWPPRTGDREVRKKIAPLLQAFVNLARGRPADVTIPLTRAEDVTIQGVVLGPGAKPIPHLELTIIDGSSRTLEPAAYALSDDNGRFRITERLRAGSYRVRVATHTWMTRAMPTFIVEDGSQDPIEIEVQVRRAGSLHGRVVKKDGSAVVGARVWLEHQRPSAERQPDAPAHVEVVTGKDGLWHIGALSTHAGKMLHAAFGNMRAPPRWSLPYKDGQEEIVLTLEPAVTLRVQVLEERSTKGIKGARVKVEPVPTVGRPHFTKFCDDDGRFEIEQVLPAKWRMRPWSWWHLEHDWKEVDLTGKSGVVEITFELDPGLAIAGRVHDDRGEPLVATIKISGVDGGKRKVWRDLKSDADGLFRATGFRQGRYVLTARADGHTQAVQRELKGGEEHLDLKLMPIPPKKPPR